MGDVRIQRGRIILSGTLSGTAPIAAVDTTKAFIRVNGLAAIPVGYTDVGGVGGGNTVLRDIGAWPTFLTASSVQIQRASGATGNTYYDFEVWEYTGPDGGPNEFKVHAFTSVVPPAGALTQGVIAGAPGDFSAEAVVSAQQRNTVIICGVMNDRVTITTGFATWYASSIIGFLDIVPASNLTRQVGNDITGNDTCRITYAVVSFTGSNWSSMHRHRMTLPPASGNTFYPGAFSTPLGDGGWPNALPNYQWSTNGAFVAPSDGAPIWYPGDGTASGHTDPTRFSVLRLKKFRTSNHVVWAVTNPELETLYMRATVASGDGGAGGVVVDHPGTGEARLALVKAADAFADILAPHEPIPSLPRVGSFAHGITASDAFGGSDYFRIFQLVSGGDKVRWRHDSRGAIPESAAWGLTVVSFPTAVSTSLSAQATMSGLPSLILGAVSTLAARVVITAESVLSNICDWFDDAAQVAWSAGAAGAGWVSGATKTAWSGAASGASWATSQVKGWFNPKDC